MRRRILFAIDEFGATSEGGSNVVVQNLIDEAKVDNEVAIIATHRVGDDLLKIQENGFTIYSIKINYPLRWRAFLSLYNPSINKKLKNIIETFQPDILHAHTIHTYLTYYLLLLSKQCGVKTIFTGHDVMPVFYGRLKQFIDSDQDGIPDTLDYKVHAWKEWLQNKFSYNPFRNQIIKSILNQVTIYTVSKELKTVFETNGIHVDKVVHNIVRTKKPSSKIIAKIKQTHQLRQPTFLMAGRIREDKGSFLGIEILQHFQSATLLLIGKQDSEARRMMELATVRGVGDRIVVLQNVPNSEMKNFYAVSDIILVLSKCFDSYPTVVIEGLAAERPVIASQFGGAKEAISSSKYGYIVNPFNIESVIQIITELQNQSFLSTRQEKNA